MPAQVAPTPEELAAENEIDPKQSNPYGEKFEGVPGSPEDLARFFDICKCTEEEALTAKHLEWGWKNFGPMDGHALAYVIKNNKTCITLECAHTCPSKRLPPPAPQHTRPFPHPATPLQPAYLVPPLSSPPPPPRAPVLNLDSPTPASIWIRPPVPRLAFAACL